MPWAFAGVLLEIAAADDVFGVLIESPDGSRAGISGNGLRIFARWLFDVGRVGTPRSTSRRPAAEVEVADDLLAEVRGARSDVAAGL